MDIDYLIATLEKQAAQIAAAGHNGWGNTMTCAAQQLRALHQDINEIYAAIPQLPITLDTCDVATDLLTRFCIDFHEYIVPVTDDSSLVPEPARSEGGENV